MAIKIDSTKPIEEMTRDEQFKEIQLFLGFALDYIDAIPEELASQFPAMPGFDRDMAEQLLQIKIEKAA